MVGFEQDSPAKDGRWRVLSKDQTLWQQKITKEFAPSLILHDGLLLEFPKDVACVHGYSPFGVGQFELLLAVVVVISMNSTLQG